MSLEGDLLYLANWTADLPNPGWPQLESGMARTLPVPGALELGNGWLLGGEILEGAAASLAYPQALENEDPHQAWLDLQQLELPLRVCAPRPGDRFQPLGLEGQTQKVADFFTNAHLPRRARRLWPLVWSGETLAWIVGFRPAHPLKLGPEVQRVLHLSLVREADHFTSPAGAA